MGNRDVSLVEAGDGCLAYLQGDGGWGWSNAGLIVGDGRSLLVDTLFDLHLTRRMLDALADHTRSAPIGTVVNTHANGDHCYGNSLVGGAEIVASTATADEMHHVPSSLLAALNADPGAAGDLFRSFFGEFDFDGVRASMGLDASVNSLTYRELQARRELIQRRMRDHVETERPRLKQ